MNSAGRVALAQMLQKSKGRFLKEISPPGADGFYPSSGGPMDG